ncbi:aldehyde dehydrogenase family protein, partial [Vibrio parahaemolyticus V-223/04]
QTRYSPKSPVAKVKMSTLPYHALAKHFNQVSGARAAQLIAKQCLNSLLT